ncbi:MAG: hypothetical protein HOV81_05905 [Kofleriaceae bacterium]|nr:hypothetical protein [Kofleriaceae bacterium]
MRSVGWLVMLACTACVSSTSVVCEDGSTCPGGFQCDVEHHRCLVPEQVAACEGKTEAQDCVFNDAPGACRDGACEAFFCGDGYVTGTEACDSANLGIDPNTGETADCITAGFYAAEGLACTSACTYDTNACTGGRCGDSEVNGPELCDGPTSKTCVSIGFDAGSVTCNAQCGFQIRDCSRFGWNPESISDVVAYAVAGSSADDQWAVGRGGRAMHYEGAFWNSVPTPVQNDLVAAWSIAKDDAWAIGQGKTSPALASVVIHWDGAAWSIVSGVPGTDYVDVWAADTNNVFIATKAQGIQHWNGTTWSVAGTFTGGEPIALRGSSPTDLWVATKPGPLYHFDGTSWTQRSPTGVEVHFIDANSATDVWIVGYVATNLGIGVIAHYDGTSWTQWQTPQDAYNNIASSAPNDTWVAGVDGIMRHWDGVAWSRSTNIGASPTGLTAISGFISLGPTEVVGVSTLNLAYRYRGQAYGTYPSLGINPFDAPVNTAMWGPSANDQYVTNVKGEVWHFDGTTWTLAFKVPQAMGNDVGARSIWGSAANDVWVGAANGSVYHWDGATWTGEVAATTSIEKIWGDGNGNVWAFSTIVAAHRTGPSAWTTTAIAGSPLSVSGTAADDIYLVTRGTSNKLSRWDGTSWAEVATGSTFPLLAVAAVASDDVHVTAEDGRMFHWNGTTWNEQIVPALADLTFIAENGHDDVVAASERDLFHFNGSEWAAIRPPIDFVPNTDDYIPIAGIQVSPGRIDMVLKRYRIRTLLRTRPLVCRPRELGACTDGVDNDCDGKLDSRDDECQQ